MSKQEFIDRLRTALSGRVSTGLIEENVSYYEDYINTQVRMGKTEESITAQLGDPRLIAKTIITANDSNATGDNADSADYTYKDGYYVDREKNTSVKTTGIPGWLWILIIVMIIFLVISAVFSLISALVPIILPVLIVVFFIKLFKDWLN